MFRCYCNDMYDFKDSTVTICNIGPYAMNNELILCYNKVLMLTLCENALISWKALRKACSCCCRSESRNFAGAAAKAAAPPSHRESVGFRFARQKCPRSEIPREAPRVARRRSPPCSAAQF